MGAGGDGGEGGGGGRGGRGEEVSEAERSVTPRQRDRSWTVPSPYQPLDDKFSSTGCIPDFRLSDELSGGGGGGGGVGGGGADGGGVTTEPWRACSCGGFDGRGGDGHGRAMAQVASKEELMRAWKACLSCGGEEQQRQPAGHINSEMAGVAMPPLLQPSPPPPVMTAAAAVGSTGIGPGPRPGAATSTTTDEALIADGGLMGVGSRVAHLARESGAFSSPTQSFSSGGCRSPGDDFGGDTVMGDSGDGGGGGGGGSRTPVHLRGARTDHGDVNDGFRGDELAEGEQGDEHGGPGWDMTGEELVPEGILSSPMQVGAHEDLELAAAIADVNAHEMRGDPRCRATTGGPGSGPPSGGPGGPGGPGLPPPPAQQQPHGGMGRAQQQGLAASLEMAGFHVRDGGVGDDDDEIDEWLDDLDPGYTLVPVSEEEFIHGQVGWTERGGRGCGFRSGGGVLFFYISCCLLLSVASCCALVRRSTALRPFLLPL